MEKRIDLIFKGKFVGFIDNENKIYKTKRTIHTYFYKFDGFGLSYGVIELLEQYGIERIHFIIEDKIYESKLGDFYVFGIDYEDNGDKQIILNKKYYREFGTTKNIQEKLLI